MYGNSSGRERVVGPTNPDFFTVREQQSHISTCITAFTTMRDGSYEVIVQDSNGNPFPEMEMDGKHYVRARTGREFQVSIKIHRDALGNFLLTNIIVDSVIDGILVGGGFCLQLKPSDAVGNAVVKGYRVNAETLKAFKFASVTAAGNNTANATTANIGCIKVSFYEAIKREQLSLHPAPTSFAAVNPALSPPCTENKKFWQQPSLTTIPGRNIATTYTPSQYRKLCATPDATAELCYHSSDMFDLLADMHNQRNAPPTPAAPPVHIDLSAEPDIVSAIVAPPPVFVDLRQEPDARQVVKLEKKRKHKDGTNTPNTVILVDLTC